jgi:hypothetical protein
MAVIHPPSNQSRASNSRDRTIAPNADPDLAAWPNLPPNERVKNADYNNEYETQGLWCAASVVALWYEVDNAVGPGKLAKTVLRNSPHHHLDRRTDSRFKRTDGDGSSGYWKSL